MGKLTVILVVLLVLAVGYAAWRMGASSIAGAATVESKYDAFAKCLTDNGVVMYGAYWCPHCQNQKKMFGDSWQYVAYVECSLPNKAGQTKECQEKGISGYPTWDIKGEFHSGELSFEKLAELTRCVLP
jgi:hypothetical protein